MTSEPMWGAWVEEYGHAMYSRSRAGSGGGLEWDFLTPDYLNALEAQLATATAEVERLKVKEESMMFYWRKWQEVSDERDTATAALAEMTKQRDEMEAAFVAQEGAYTRGLTDGISRMEAALAEAEKARTEATELLRLLNTGQRSRHDPEIEGFLTYAALASLRKETDTVDGSRRVQTDNSSPEGS